MGLTMRASIAILIGAIILCAQAQEDLPTFRCPEDNGFFPDPEQCDLYYECIDNIPEAKLCPDGLLFEDGNPNQEKCDYPFNVECGDREYVEEPEVCYKFYNCVYGKPHELPCATTLIFDEAQGTCVRPEQGSVYAKKCAVKEVKEDIEGFFCPEEDVL